MGLLWFTARHVHGIICSKASQAAVLHLRRTRKWCKNDPPPLLCSLWWVTHPRHYSFQGWILCSKLLRQGLCGTIRGQEDALMMYFLVIVIVNAEGSISGPRASDVCRSHHLTSGLSPGVISGGSFFHLLVLWRWWGLRLSLKGVKFLLRWVEVPTSMNPAEPKKGIEARQKLLIFWGPTTSLIRIVLTGLPAQSDPTYLFGLPDPNSIYTPTVKGDGPFFLAHRHVQALTWGPASRPLFFVIFDFCAHLWVRGLIRVTTPTRIRLLCRFSEMATASKQPDLDRNGTIKALSLYVLIPSSY